MRLPQNYLHLRLKAELGQVFYLYGTKGATKWFTSLSPESKEAFESLVDLSGDPGPFYSYGLSRLGEYLLGRKSR